MTYKSFILIVLGISLLLEGSACKKKGTDRCADSEYYPYHQYSGAFCCFRCTISGSRADRNRIYRESKLKKISSSRLPDASGKGKPRSDCYFGGSIGGRLFTL